MKSDEELNKELLEDLDFIYQSYMDMLKQGRSRVTALNTLIRALKETHKYFNYIQRDVESKKLVLDRMSIRKMIEQRRNEKK